MNRLLTSAAMLFAIMATASAKPLTVANFDADPIGTKYTMWGFYGGDGGATAVVEADPANSSNHVLHIKISSWNTFVELQVPSEYAGSKLTDRFNRLTFRLYRSNADQNDWKQLPVFYGSDRIYYDGDGNYPQQGDKAKWQDRSVNLSKVPANSTATALHFGFHSEASDYYIDDVKLYGDGDEYEYYPDGKLDICVNNTSSNYTVYNTPTLIPAGESLSVYTSRYSDFNAVLAGSGTLNLYCGGERSYLGEHSGKTYPDWSNYTGDVHIYPYKDVISSAGFYGVIMPHNGKTFTVSDIEGSILGGKVCKMLSGNRVWLHNGATIAFESGVRAASFGELNTEAGSTIQGYYKSSSTAGGYVIVGAKGTDATLAGTIASPNAPVGLIKVGKGTYSITSNNNVINASVRILGGRVNMNNDAAAAEKSKLSGATGSTGSVPAVYVFGDGVLGGTGSVGDRVECYGTIEPGTASETGTLTFKDYTASNRIAYITLHPDARLRFKVASASQHDMLRVPRIDFSSATEQFSTSDNGARIVVSLMEGCTLNIGDEIELLRSEKGVKDHASLAYRWDIRYPSRYTWTSIERENEDGSYSLIIKVVALEDDPANANNDNENDDDNKIDNTITDTFTDDGDTNPMRYYADQSGLYIGVAVPAYGMTLATTDAKATLVKTEFNMVEAENCMKWDALEPQRGVFTYTDGDKLATFAKRNNMYVRGHTLAWYQQLPAWLSVDGKKNDKGWTKAQLLEILKNHIMNVAKHYRGKVDEWDVVNECLEDDQSIVYSNPNGYRLRQESVWTKVIGEEYIDSAFVWAHQADPDAKLYLNDYSNESKGYAKCEAFYNLAKRLKNSGIPIHGVGFQCHLDVGLGYIDNIRQNLARYADLGLECTITELDLGSYDHSEAMRQQQARDYYQIVNNAMQLQHCKKVLIWGITDGMSWRTNSAPLLFEDNLSKKPAYYAVRKALRKVAAGIDEVEIDADTAVDGSVVSREYYSLSGVRLSKQSNGICIVRERMSNGKVRASKVNCM